MKCLGNIPNLPSVIPVKGVVAVSGGKARDSGQGPFFAIDGGGYAVQKQFWGDKVNTQSGDFYWVSVDLTVYYRFQKQGNTSGFGAFAWADAILLTPDKLYKSTCTGSGNSTRQ